MKRSILRSTEVNQLPRQIEKDSILIVSIWNVNFLRKLLRNRMSKRDQEVPGVKA